jgi:hypothetical protein
VEVCLVSFFLGATSLTAVDDTFAAWVGVLSPERSRG